MRHQWVSMAEYESASTAINSGVWIVGRRTIWDCVLNVAAMDSGLTLDVVVYASPTGVFDGEETALVSFTQVAAASAPTTETKSAPADFTITTYADLYILVEWTIVGTGSVFFELEADGKWLDVTSATDKALMRKRLQSQANLADRLKEAEDKLQAHLTRMTGSGELYALPSTALTGTIKQLSELTRTAIAKQMDWDLGEEITRAASEGGSESKQKRLRNRSEIAKDAMDLLRPVLDLSNVTSLEAIP